MMWYHTDETPCEIEDLERWVRCADNVEAVYEREEFGLCDSMSGEGRGPGSCESLSGPCDGLWDCDWAVEAGNARWWGLRVAVEGEGALEDLLLGWYGV